MATEKAWYWLAAGVLALGLNGAYQDGEFPWVHNLADRSCALLERVTEQKDRFVAMTEIMFGREPSSLARAQERLARLQERLSTTQVDRIQRRLEVAQCKIARAQAKVVVLEHSQLCSGTSHFVVHVPSVNMPAMPAVNVREFMSAVTVPSVQIPEINIPQVRVPRITIPEVRVPQIHVPPVHVQVDSDDSDGLI
jgi:hypothetical protein